MAKKQRSAYVLSSEYTTRFFEGFDWKAMSAVLPVKERYIVSAIKINNHWAAVILDQEESLLSILDPVEAVEQEFLE